MIKFWNLWFFKTNQEKKYIKSLKTYFNKEFTKFDLTQINSVYIGGSFSRRDLAKNSDIDLYIILKDNQKLKNNITIAKESKNNLISEHIYSIKELKEEELFCDDKFNRTVPPRYVVKNIKDYKLIKGKAIKLKNDVNENEYLKKEIFVIKMLENKNNITSETLKVICKNVFYITYFRSNFKFKFHRRKILNNLDKSHILNLCNKVRLNPKYYIENKNDIFKKINTYINSKKL